MDVDTERDTNVQGKLTDIKDSHRIHKVYTVRKKGLTPFQKCLAVTIGFSAVLLGDGFIYHLSVMFVELQREFGTSKAETAVVQSVAMGTSMIGGIFSGLCITKFGLRETGFLGATLQFLGIAVSYFATNISYLVVSLGLITGLGVASNFAFACTTVAYSFTGSDQVIALGLISIGGGVGSVAYAYIYNYLSSDYGWRGTLLIQSGIVLHHFVVNFLSLELQPLICTQKTKEGEYDEVSTKLRRVLTDVFFMTYITVASFSVALLLIMMIFHTDFFESRGYGKSSAVFFYFTMSLAGTITRLLPGPLKKIFHVDVLYLQASGILIGTIGYGLLPISKTYASAMSLNILIGISVGFGMALFAAGITVLVDKRHFPIGNGLSSTLCGVFTIAGGPIAGHIEDTTGSYDWLYYGTGISMMTCAVSIICLAVKRRHASIEHIRIDSSEN